MKKYTKFLLIFGLMAGSVNMDAALPRIPNPFGFSALMKKAVALSEPIQQQLIIAAALGAAAFAPQIISGIWSEISERYEMFFIQKDYSDPDKLNRELHGIAINASIIPQEYKDLVGAETNTLISRPVIFYGPQGTGKSLMPKKIAAFYQQDLYTINAGDLFSGHSPARLKRFLRYEVERVSRKTKFGKKSILVLDDFPDTLLNHKDFTSMWKDLFSLEKENTSLALQYPNVKIIITTNQNILPTEERDDIENRQSRNEISQTYAESILIKDISPALKDRFKAIKMDTPSPKALEDYISEGCKLDLHTAAQGFSKKTLINDNKQEQEYWFRSWNKWSLSSQSTRNTVLTEKDFISPAMHARAKTIHENHLVSLSTKIKPAIIRPWKWNSTLYSQIQDYLSLWHQGYITENIDINITNDNLNSVEKDHDISIKDRFVNECFSLQYRAIRDNILAPATEHVKQKITEQVNTLPNNVARINNETNKITPIILLKFAQKYNRQRKLSRNKQEAAKLYIAANQDEREEDNYKQLLKYSLTDDIEEANQIPISDVHRGRIPRIVRSNSFNTFFGLAPEVAVEA